MPQTAAIRQAIVAGEDLLGDDWERQLDDVRRDLLGRNTQARLVRRPRSAGLNPHHEHTPSYHAHRPALLSDSRRAAARDNVPHCYEFDSDQPLAGPRGNVRLDARGNLRG